MAFSHLVALDFLSGHGYYFSIPLFSDRRQNMSEFSQVTGANFKQQVLDSARPVLVDFSATWCSPCKLLDPLLTQLVHSWGDKVTLVKIDVDQEPDLAANYQVMGMPTVILFVKGQPVQRITGFQPKDRLESKFLPYI
jgi:thioredoxin 1